MLHQAREEGGVLNAPRGSIVASTGALFLGALVACAPSASMPEPELRALVEAAKPRGRPLVVNHWATWCGPCVDEMPYLAEVAKRYEGRVDFLGVSWDRFIGDDPVERTIAEVDRVRAKTGTTYPTFLAPKDPDGVARELALEAEFIPQTYVFAASGEKVWSFVSELVEDSEKAAFEKAIEHALERSR